MRAPGGFRRQFDIACEVEVEDGSSPIPHQVVADLAELFDPQGPFSRFAKPSLPPDQIEIVDGKSRLKGATEAVRADKAAMDASARLIQVAKKSGKKLDTQEALEKFANATGDEKAIRAFADWRRAVADLQAARKLAYNAVRLTTKPLTRPRAAPKRESTRLTEVELLERDSWIMGKMLGEIQEGRTVSDAAQSIGEKLKLSERQVTQIWGDARKAHPKFLANLPRAKKRRTHIY